MKKYKKILLIASAALIVGGGIISVAGLALGGRPGFVITRKGIKTPDDTKGEFIEDSKSLKDIKNLDIDFADGKIQILQGEEFRIEYGYDKAQMDVNETIENGTYKLTCKYLSSWNFYPLGNIGFNFDSMNQVNYLNIYIPEGTKLEDVKLSNDYGNVVADLQETPFETASFRLSSGDFEASGLKCSEMNLDMDYGKLDLKDSDIDNVTISNDSGKGSISNIDANSMKLEFDYGDLKISDIAADKMSVTNSSGKVEIEDAKGKELSVKADYGRINLVDVTMDTDISLNSSSGDINMEKVKTGELTLLSDYGNVKGEQLEAKTSDMKLSSGDCEISEFTAKNTKIDSDYGKIDLLMTGKEADYDMALITDYGKVYINEEEHGTDLTREKGASNKLDLKTDSGNINIETK